MTSHGRGAFGLRLKVPSTSVALAGWLDVMLLYVSNDQDFQDSFLLSHLYCMSQVYSAYVQPRVVTLSSLSLQGIEVHLRTMTQLSLQIVSNTAGLNSYVQTAGRSCHQGGGNLVFTQKPPYQSRHRAPTSRDRLPVDELGEGLTATAHGFKSP